MDNFERLFYDYVEAKKGYWKIHKRELMPLESLIETYGKTKTRHFINECLDNIDKYDKDVFVKSRFSTDAFSNVEGYIMRTRLGMTPHFTKEQAEVVSSLLEEDGFSVIFIESKNQYKYRYDEYSDWAYATGFKAMTDEGMKMLYPIGFDFFGWREENEG